MNTLGDTAFLENRWREPVPFNLDCQNGLAVTHTSSHAWLSTPFSVWRASLAAESLAISDDVIACSLQLRAYSGELTVELCNDQGQYSIVGTEPCVCPVLCIGCQIHFSPGYRTLNGNEYSSGQSFFLQACEHVSAGGKARLILEACDGWRLLEKWTARSQFRWNPAAEDTSVKEILAQILARCGLKLEVVSQSSVITGFYPDFTLHPGEDGQSAVDRLLSFVPDVLMIEGLTCYLINLQAADTACYSYGAAHAILEGRYLTAAYRVNRIRVEGAGVAAESFAWPEIASNGDILLIVEDLNADTAARAQDLGEARLRKTAIAAVNGSIHIPVNCGQQLYDVIEITDVRAGLIAVRRRVLGMDLTYLPAKGIYEQRLVLGGV